MLSKDVVVILTVDGNHDSYTIGYISFITFITFIDFTT